MPSTPAEGNAGASGTAADGTDNSITGCADVCTGRGARAKQSRPLRSDAAGGVKRLAMDGVAKSGAANVMSGNAPGAPGSRA